MKGLLITLIIALGGLLAFSFFRYNSKDTRADFNQHISQEAPIIKTTPPLIETKPTLGIEVKPESSTIIIEPIEADENSFNPPPVSINHTVPFFPQAPDANRNLPRQEACEEASIILAAYFIQGKSLSKEQFKQDIGAMIPLQEELFGTYLDTDIAQTKILYDRFYDGTSHIIDDPSIADLKAALARGHLIVAPFAGRKLHNPHFSGQGPRYHMLVIRGYDEVYFYTNDVGTSRGENYRYTHDILMDALHDLTDGDMQQGAKRVLVITR